MASIALADVGSFKPNSRRSTPVSAARFDAVSRFTNWPVATKREDMLGIPYVYMTVLTYCQKKRGLGAAHSEESHEH